MVRSRPTGDARWKPLLRGPGVSLNVVTDSMAESMLVVVRTATEPVRTVVWCFDTASLVVPNEVVAGRFGLIVALNKHAAVDAWRHLPAGARS